MTCLDDKEDFNLIKNEPSLPGVFYDFINQCRLSYGPNATHCKVRQVINLNVVSPIRFSNCKNKKTLILKGPFKRRMLRALVQNER